MSIDPVSITTLIGVGALLIEKIFSYLTSRQSVKCCNGGIDIEEGAITGNNATINSNSPSLNVSKKTTINT